MTKVLVTEQYLQDIGDSIRAKLRSEDTFLPSEMSGAIDGIESAIAATLVSKTVTANGTYDSADDGVDGYSEVVVAVPNTYGASDNGKVLLNGEFVAQTSRSVTANGTYDTTTNNEMVVNVPQNVGPKTVTDNGTYFAEDDSLLGYSSFTVNVPKSDINWLEEVSTYADISTTYTNPALNDAVCVSSTGESYTYDGTQWVLMWVEYTYAEATTILESVS